MSQADDIIIVTHPRYPRYKVSSDGRVMGIRGGWLKPAPSPQGYLGVTMMDAGRQFTGKIHQLVCEAFHGAKPEWAECVRHLDGDNQNNLASNLAWGTHAENVADSIRHGTKARLTGVRNARTKLTECQIREILLSYESQTALAQRFNVSQPHISNLRRGKRWQWLREELGLA